MLPSGHYQYLGYFLMYELLRMFILCHADPLSIGSYFTFACQSLSPAFLFPSLLSAPPVPRKEDGIVWDWAAMGISQNNNTKILIVSYHTPLKNTMGISIVTSFEVGKEIIFIIFQNQWKKRKKNFLNLSYFWQSQFLHAINLRSSHLQP